MILEKARAQLAKAYSEAGPQAFLPPGFLDLLLGILMDLLKGCIGSGNNPLNVADKRPLLARLQARRAVVDELTRQYGVGAFRRHNGARMVDALLLAAKDASEEDVQALVQDHTENWDL